MPDNVSLPFSESPATRSARRGASSLEALVAFSLLATVLTVAAPLVAGHHRVLASARSYRFAMDELSNHLERLADTPVEQLSAEVDSLTPSALALERLPSVALSGVVDETDIGVRVVLRISWSQAHGRASPLSLAAWVIPPREQSSDQSEQGEGA